MDVSAIIERQRALVRGGTTRSRESRVDRLRRLSRALEARESELLEALHADLRKPPHEAYVSEIGFVQSEIRHAIRHLPSWMKRRRRRVPLLAWPGSAFVQPEPYGVGLILGPWNYPAQLLLSPLVGALAAGNCAVLKPSELAPHTAEAVSRLVASTFSPEEVVVVTGGSDVAEELLRHRFDVIFFTGSTRVGRLVMAAAARHGTPVTLELGGKSPCLVCADAPLETTARRIAWGKFLNAGQTCVAPDYVLVDRRVSEGLVEALKRAVRAFYGEDPQQSPDYGRIVNQRHLQRLAALLKDGRIVHGGQVDLEDLYLAPTLIMQARWDTPIMQEEIFGPILPVVEFDRLEEALTLVRERPTPLALYLFTRDAAVQQTVLEQTRSGGVCINDTISQIVARELPFGGLGESGLGAYHGRASFDCFSHRRAVMRRAFWMDSRLRYPPPRISLRSLRKAARFLLGG